MELTIYTYGQKNEMRLTFSGYGAHSDGDGSIAILPCDFETAGVITLSAFSAKLS